MRGDSLSLPSALEKDPWLVVLGSVNMGISSQGVGKCC